MNGEIVFNPENCPKLEKITPEKIIVVRYVCMNGEIVNNLSECEIFKENLETTTKKLGTTTSIKIKTETTTTTIITTTQYTTIQQTTTTTTTTTTTLEEFNECVELGCPPETKFVGSSKSDKYHYCSCRYAKKIKKENLICFESVEDAQEKGYKPCGVCKPP